MRLYLAPSEAPTVADGNGRTDLDARDTRIWLGVLPLSPGIVKRIEERGAVAIPDPTERGAAPAVLSASLGEPGTAIEGPR